MTAYRPAPRRSSTEPKPCAARARPGVCASRHSVPMPVSSSRLHTESAPFSRPSRPAPHLARPANRPLVHCCALLSAPFSGRLFRVPISSKRPESGNPCTERKKKTKKISCPEEQLRLAAELQFRRQVCFDFAKHESSESSRSETFSLSKYKNRGTRPRFLCNHEVIAILCARPRGSVSIAKTDFTGGAGKNRVFSTGWRARRAAPTGTDSPPCASRPPP